MAMTRVCQKSICDYQDCKNKGFMFTSKRSGTEKAAQKIKEGRGRGGGWAHHSISYSAKVRILIEVPYH